MPDTSVPPCVPLVPFKLLRRCCIAKGVSLYKYVVGSFRGDTTESRSFFCCPQPPLVLQPDLMRTYFPGTGTLGCGVWCEAGTPCSQDIPPSFLSTIRGCRNNPFHVSAPPTSLDGCDFFNSIVIRLPFNLISDASE